MPGTDTGGAAVVEKRSLSRRTVLTAAAWSVPAIAIANATPAFAAASGCEPIAIDMNAWTIAKSGVGDSVVDTGIEGDYCQFGGDSQSYGASGSANGTDWMYALSPGYITQPGYYYQMKLEIATQGGYDPNIGTPGNTPCETVNSDIIAFIRDNAGSSTTANQGLQVLHGFQSQASASSSARSGVSVSGQPLPSSVPYRTVAFPSQDPRHLWDNLYRCSGGYGYGVSTTASGDLVSPDSSDKPETYTANVVFQATSTSTQLGLEFVPFLTQHKTNNDDYRVYITLECVGPTPPTP